MLRKWLLISAALSLAASYFVLPYFTPQLYLRADTNIHACPASGDVSDPDVKRDRRQYPSASPSFKVVRFADTGAYVRVCERTDVFYELQAIQGPMLVIVYTHGWFHNATSPDKARFESLVHTLDQAEKKKQNPRHVVGIYLAWNGTSGFTAIDYLTFWSRKSAADQISAWGNATAFLGATANIVKANSRNQIILVGHSLGARILFSAVNQLLIFNVMRAHPGGSDKHYEHVHGPADLVILLNPAIEASSYVALESIRRDKEQFAPNQKPVLITISTDNDFATTYLFRMGQWLGTLREEEDLTTIGNYKKFFTHRLLSKTQSCDDPQKLGACTCKGAACIVRTDFVQPTNPFWLVTTDKSILDNHGGIWSDSFKAFLQELILSSHLNG